MKTIRTAIELSLLGNVSAQSDKFAQSLNRLESSGRRSLLGVANMANSTHNALGTVFNKGSALLGSVGLAVSGKSVADLETRLTRLRLQAGISKEEIVYALDAIQSPMSLYEPVYTEGGDTLYVMDQISDKKNREENWVQDLALQDAISRLNPREKYIIRLRFFEGRTQMEVASEIGISQAQVSRLEKSALRAMRGYLS